MAYLQEFSPYFQMIAPYRLTVANKGDAGIDLRATGKQAVVGEGKHIIGDDTHYIIPPHKTLTINTEARIKELSYNKVGLLTLRSSIAKKGLIIMNSPGIIDSGYRGEIKAMVHNLTDEPILLERGARFCQLVIMIHCATNVPVEDEEDGERGEGGFGSSD